jgi:hypothetical protein
LCGHVSSSTSFNPNVVYGMGSIRSGQGMDDLLGSN